MRKRKIILMIAIIVIAFSLFIGKTINCVEAANAPTYEELISAKKSLQNIIAFFEKYNYNINAQDIVNAYDSKGQASQAEKWVQQVYSMTTATNYNTDISKEYNNNQAKIKEAKEKLNKINTICNPNRNLQKSVHDIAYNSRTQGTIVEIDKTNQEDLKKWDAKKILNNYKSHIASLKGGEEGQKVLDNWISKVEKYNPSDVKTKKLKEQFLADAAKTREQLEQETVDKYQKEDDQKDNKDNNSSTTVYQQPKIESNGNSASSNLNDMISDAEDFINQGDMQHDDSSLQKFSQTLYSILLVIGTIVAVIMGAILGLKLMTASAEGKAEAKKYLVTYAVGCIVVFGGFAIWKIAITILQGI